ncbi:histone deacetylase family protein [Teredinibacter turnerae]|uniref:histone deacetylase family protein n=1 Tax=Teredinibacter turnerae TaxID=2426 RepID=UPI0005F7E1F1|nr:histone deacetylase family protein [Teredinibacter turnerae]
MTTAYITHPECAKHDVGDEHPEAPERLSAINDALISLRIMDFLQCHDARPAERSALALAHSEAHIKRVYDKSPLMGLRQLDPDTFMNPHSLAAALLGVGAVMQAVDLVMAGKVKNAFCSVRPPGHHAERDKAMGFCIFNNIAIGALHALEHHGLKKIAIVDFDVHHGNGTENIFLHDDRVLFCSTFQSPLYPDTFAESEPGHIVNVALEPGTKGDLFRQQVSERILPELDAFEPEFIFISAGFDAHKQDPLAHLSLLEDDYRWITHQLLDVAEKHADRRVVSALEGGYNLEALATSVCAHVGCLVGLHHAG